MKAAVKVALARGLTRRVHAVRVGLGSDVIVRWAITVMTPVLAALCFVSSASALLVDEYIGGSELLVQDGCTSPVVVDKTLPAGATGVVIHGPKPGEPLQGDSGEELARVVSASARRSAERVHVFVVAQGVGAHCERQETWEARLPLSIAFKVPRRVFFVGASGRAVERPRVVYPGNWPIRIVRWRRWGGPVAEAGGRLPYNDCRPNCAAGRITWYPAEVRLSRPEECNANGRLEYMDLSWRAVGKRRPPKGRMGRVSFDYRCGAPNG